MRDCKEFKWENRRRGSCDHVIRTGIADQDEIGVVLRKKNPGYELKWAAYGDMHDTVGDRCNKLKQAYATAVAKRQAMAQGFRVQEQQRQDGSIQLMLSK